MKTPLSDRHGIDPQRIKDPTQRDEPRMERPVPRKIAPPKAPFKLRMWSYDIAREQTPTVEILSEMARRTLDSGYNAIGLYLEHRFRYECAPWAAGQILLDRTDIRRLRRMFPELQIVPMINLLGHMEGFLYTEFGSCFAEERFKGYQACPSNPAFVKLCEQMVDEVLNAFDSEIIHLGGDETKQLGRCPQCSSRVRTYESDSTSEFQNDGYAGLYSHHFEPLCQRVLDQGRRPAIWGDMLLAHERARVPPQTLVFDWQYHSGISETAPKLMRRGHEVVGCPTLKTFNAPWIDLEGSEENIKLVACDASEIGAYGLCLTTWEGSMFGHYETWLPAIMNVGQFFSGGELNLIDSYGPYAPHAKLLGVELPAIGQPFIPGRIRSELKCRYLLFGDPILFWRLHAEQLNEEKRKKTQAICNSILDGCRDDQLSSVSKFISSIVLFVESMDAARSHYGRGDFSASTKILRSQIEAFEELAQFANDNVRRGGSLADVERCMLAASSLRQIVRRIKAVQKDRMGYIPSFDHITHHRYMPYDQGAWWRINQWADD